MSKDSVESFFKFDENKNEHNASLEAVIRFFLLDILKMRSDGGTVHIRVIT